jgi:hypothetical protein
MKGFFEGIGGGLLSGAEWTSNQAGGIANTINPGTGDWLESAADIFGEGSGILLDAASTDIGIGFSDIWDGASARFD